jgi:hypothetical protein
MSAVNTAHTFDKKHSVALGEDNVLENLEPFHLDAGGYKSTYFHGSLKVATSPQTYRKTESTTQEMINLSLQRFLFDE